MSDRKDNPFYDKQPPNFRYLEHEKYCGNCANIGLLPNCRGPYCKKYVLMGNLHYGNSNSVVCDDWEKTKDE